MKPRSTTPRRSEAALELAWRVHDTAAGSIGKADAKAGFVATLNTAMLAGVVTLTNLDRLAMTPRTLVYIGGGLMVAAILLAGAVVLPILRAREAEDQAPGDFLYFGAVRLHSADALAYRLTAEDTFEGVCEQSITLSRLSWLKHRLLQLSLLATIAGTNLVGWTLLIAGGAR